MTFWQENYSFIREVYDTRYQKMVEWMDNVEMAIQKVCASKVYTSAEFKREKDNFHVKKLLWEETSTLILILVTVQESGKSRNQKMVDWDTWNSHEG